MIALLLAGLALAAPRGVERHAEAPAGLDDVMVRRVALVVGIDGYADRELGALAFAGKDARDVASLLDDPDQGGFSEVTLVEGDAVTRDALWRALERATVDLQPNDTFVLYFAGHSTLRLTPAGTQLYLLTSEGELQRPDATGVSMAELEQFLDGLHVRQQVVVVDACQSLSSQTRAQVKRLRGPVPDPLAWVHEPGASEVQLYSAALYQAAQEDPDLGNGVYTHFLLDGLRGAADEDRDGRVEVMEAHRYAAARTMAHTGQTQVPLARTRSMGREQIFLSGRPATLSELGAADAQPGNGGARGAMPRGRWVLGTGPTLTADLQPDTTTIPLSWRVFVGERSGAWQPTASLGATVGPWPDPAVVTLTHAEARMARVVGNTLRTGVEGAVGLYTRVHQRSPRYYGGGAVQAAPTAALGVPLRVVQRSWSVGVLPRVVSTYVVQAPRVRALPEVSLTVEIGI